MSGHVYPIEHKGQTYQLWSVTSIIGLFNELGLLQDRAYFKRGLSTTVGNQADDVITQICNGTPVTKEQWLTLSEPVQNCVLAFMRWSKEVGFKPRYSQVVVYSLRLGYAGRLDQIGFADGVLGLYDWKTGIAHPEMLRLQLVLYYIAYLETYPKRKIRQLRGVYFDKAKGTFSEIRIDMAEVETIFNQFLELLGQVDYELLRAWGGLNTLKLRDKNIGGITVTSKELAVRGSTELQTNREQAIADLRYFYQDAPEETIVKAAMLISYHGYSPENVFIIGYKNNKTGGVDYSIVVGIKGKREAVVKGGNRGLNYVFGDDFFPRLMTEAEERKVYGKVDQGAIAAICKISDTLGNTVVGFGKYSLSDTPKGMEKGNTRENMAMIRAENNALGKLPNVKALPPDVEVMDERYIDAEYTQVPVFEENDTEKLSKAMPAQPQEESVPAEKTPQGIECPLHPGHFFQEMKNKKTGATWFSHKIDGDDRFPKGYCNKQDLPKYINQETGEVIQQPEAKAAPAQGKKVSEEDVKFQHSLIAYRDKLGWTKEGGQLLALFNEKFKGFDSPFSLSAKEREEFLNILDAKCKEQTEQAKMM